ncbi:MAG: rod shape-determining protein [Bacteroidales bacterium]
MALSFLTQEIAIDLGTANTIILMNDKVILDEPSIVAIDQNSGQPIAFGQKARMMHGKTHANIKTVRPLRDGVIADFNAAEQMLRGFIKQINYRKSIFTPSLKMVICIPSGSTEVEIRAVRDSAEHAGARDVYLIYEPMAAALGIGLDVEAPTGNMIVDVGGGTIEIAVISLGGIVVNQSIRVAGDIFTDEIQQYMRQQHSIKIGELTAEDIKMKVGAALTEMEEYPEPYIVRGPNLMTAHPVEVAVTSQEIAHSIDKSIAKIEASIIQVLEQTPPELYSDIVRNGINITGGGALLRGLDRRLTEKINIKFIVHQDPLLSVAIGTSLALRNSEKLSFLKR